MSKAWKRCQTDFVNMTCSCQKQPKKKKIKVVQLDMFENEKKKWAKKAR